MSKNAYTKYKQTAVLSASKEQILLMLYEAAIRFTKLAIEACEKNNIQDRGHNILRAFDIIAELQATLDHKVAGDLPKQLDQLYRFIMEKYTEANISGNKEPLESCVVVLENLYAGWKQVIGGTNHGGTNVNGTGGAA